MANTTARPTDIPAAATTFDSVEEFLAHAQALETEAAERYEEMADAMDVHNNHDVARLFTSLAEAGRKHAQRMVECAHGRELPKIQPWEFKWENMEAPETAEMQDIHYLMTPHHALEMARCVEVQAQAYYSAVAEANTNTEISSLAKEFAAEEAVHVDLLERWIVRYPEPGADWDYDPDPPSMPE